MFRIHLYPSKDLKKILDTLDECYKEYHIETEKNKPLEYTLHYYYHTIPTDTSILIDPTEKEIEITIKYIKGSEDSVYYIGSTIQIYLNNQNIPVNHKKRSREGSIDEKKAPPPSPAIRPLKEGKKIESSANIDEMMNDIFTNILQDSKTCSYDKKEHFYESIASFSETEQGRLFLNKHIPFLLDSITLSSLFEDCKITRTINRCASTALANVLETITEISPETINLIDQTIKKVPSTSIKMRRECARILGYIILLQLSNL